MNEPLSRSIGTELPKEMARVRDKIMPLYQELGPAGGLALSLMRASLDVATRALAEGDAVACIQAYEDLKGYTA